MKECKNLKIILEDLEIDFEILCLFSVIQTQKLLGFHQERSRAKRELENFLVLKEQCLESLQSLKRQTS